MVHAFFILSLLFETLDNSAVMKLVAAGLAPDVIVMKIERSEGAFDTSTDGLIALKKAGVPDAVIKAMLLHEPPAAPAAPPVPAAPPAPPAPPIPPAATGEICANVKQYTTGNDGYGWYPSSVCVSSTAVSIDEQQLPMSTVAVHCISNALVGVDEWWLADRKEVFRFRGEDDALKTLSNALARVPHGKCTDRAMKNLMPAQTR